MSKRISITFNLVPTLTIVFLVLKLCKVIDWSWWWVLSPSWIPAVLVIVLLILKELLNAKVCRY